MSSARKKLIHPFICSFEGCHATFSKNSKLVYHMGKHTAERPFVCEEENCNKSYTNPAHLRRHKKVSHDKQTEKVRCPFEGCSVELTKNNLKKHCKRKHNPDREYPYPCKGCGRGFFKKRELLQHSFEHTGIPPFRCENCDLRFLTLRDCNRHKRIHTIYPCVCGETFERWSYLLTHRKKCEKARPKCNVCNKLFSNTSNLKAHQDLHKNIEGRDVFPCTYENCSRFYFQKKNLRQHINLHHKQRDEAVKIPCTQANCKQTFKKELYLRRHLAKVHTVDVKPKPPRRRRKDKNVPRKSTAGKLVGLDLPANCNKEAVAEILNAVHCEENYANGALETETDKENCAFFEIMDEQNHTSKKEVQVVC